MDQNVTAETNRMPISEIKQKMKFTGKVLKTTLAGAAIDIGAEKPAMLHVSQMVSNQNEPILSVSDYLKEDEEIEVWVKRVRDQRIELTMVKPLDLEWREIKTGLAVKGVVVRLETFGAFVEIGAERPGLIHISEMAHGYVRTPADVMKEGDEIEAEIIDFNRKKKQIKLSIKALTPEPEKEEKVDQQTPVFYTDDQTKKEKPIRKKREKKNRKKDSNEYSSLEFDLANGQAEEEPTAMELAIRAAMDKANAKKHESKKKVAKPSPVQDDLLARTLDQKTS
ncbi:MAG: S1 RNA-binding domain-containing protein [Anaerolineaceae bacterium]|jgi:ribosomal protein S1|nr:S1 RNA-binding domain-containing protein [Anaerolineaceae bacterium]